MQTEKKSIESENKYLSLWMAFLIAVKFVLKGINCTVRGGYE